jgi:3-oxo-5-alpha-steroid 4-dehydrogenase 1
MSAFWTSIQSFGHVAPWCVLAAAAVVFPLLFFVTAPYGRHFRPGWGPAIGSRAGWIAMEWPSVVLFALVWVASLGLVFNVVNATGNAVALVDRPFDPSFAAGVVLFLVGFLTNVHSDHVLRTLRAPGESGYRVPFGGGFRYVSAPNYLGEIVEWVGFALAAQTLAAWAFAAFTFANLAPRAIANHRWYRERFPDYPDERRALIPFVW